MSEEKTSKRARLLLAALLIIWAAASVNALLELEEEGAQVCERLTHSFEKYPGEARPCAVSTFDAEGEHVRTRRAHYEGGELTLAEFDENGDGSYDKALDCTWGGRVTMPLRHTGKWLGVVVSKEMTEGAPVLEFVEERTESEGEHTVVFYEASDERLGRGHRRIDRRNADEQLIERRFFQGSFDSPMRTLVMTYDEQGRVETVSRRTRMPATESFTRLEYQCGSTGR